MASSAVAQTAVPSVIAPKCTNESLESTLHIFRAPGPMQVVAVDYRNPNKTSCSLRVEEPSGLRIVTLTHGETAHTTLRWATEPSAQSSRCSPQRELTITVNESPGGIVIRAPTLLNQICSDVEQTTYAPGLFVPEWKADAPEPPPLPKLEASTSKSSYYQSEAINLHLEIEPFSPEFPSAKSGCPVFFTTFRTAQAYEIVEFLPFYSINCRKDKMEQGKSGNRISFDIDAQKIIRTDEPGEQSFVFTQLSGYTAQGEARLTDSNSFHFNLKDPALEPNPWGATQEGVRVALRLDKRTYRVGEDIPLHIAVQVLSEDRLIFPEPFLRRSSPTQDFGRALHFVVVDADGPLPRGDDPNNLSERSRAFSNIDTCPDPVPYGQIVPLERSLGHHGLLPTHPGTYKVLVSWSPYVQEAGVSCTSAANARTSPRPAKPLVTVTSLPFTIEVLPPLEAAPEPVPARFPGRKVYDVWHSLPEYTLWKNHFTLTDTPWGDKTALLQNATRLDWLRLSLTRNWSPGELVNEFAPGGEFAGWRFATADEVHAMLADFAGSPYGISTDLSIERKLQQLLGGPLKNESNVNEGWSRRSTYGMVGDSTQLPAEARAVGQVPAAPCSDCEKMSRYSFVDLFDYEKDGKFLALLTLYPHGMGYDPIWREGFFLVRLHQP